MASGGRVSGAAAWRRPSSLTTGAGDDPAAAGTQSAPRCHAGRVATGTRGSLSHDRQSVHHFPQLTAAEPPAEKKVLLPVSGTKKPARSFATSLIVLSLSTSSLLTRWAAISA